MTTPPREQQGGGGPTGARPLTAGAARTEETAGGQAASAGAVPREVLCIPATVTAAAPGRGGRTAARPGEPRATRAGWREAARRTAGPRHRPALPPARDRVAARRLPASTTAALRRTAAWAAWRSA